MWEYGNETKKNFEHERSNNQTGCKQTTVFSRVIQMFVSENCLEPLQALQGKVNDDDCL